jgi:hypothetical protein
MSMAENGIGIVLRTKNDHVWFLGHFQDEDESCGKERDCAPLFTISD